MRKWKEEQQERLMKKDQEESTAMEELKVEGQAGVGGLVQEVRDTGGEDQVLKPGGGDQVRDRGDEWHRARHRVGEGVQTLRLQLKGSWSHKRRLENEVNSASTQAKSDCESLDSQTNSEVRNCIYFIKYFCTGDSFNISYYHNS